MISYVIIDDEPNPRELLAYLIDSLNLPFRLVGDAGSLLEGVDLIKKVRPQVVFLDIQMPLKSGLKIREFLNEEEFNFKLIFVTAYDKYSIDAIRLTTFDYLLKPINIDNLSVCLNRIIDKTNRTTDKNNHKLDVDNSNVIVLNTHEGTYFVDIKDVVCIKADGMYSFFHLVDRNLISSKPLKNYQNLYSDLFRCHRSFIVNLKHVQKVRGSSVELTNNIKVTVSRQNRKELVELIAFT